MLLKSKTAKQVILTNGGDHFNNRALFSANHGDVRALWKSYVNLLIMVFLFSLNFPIAAQACTLLEEDDLLEQIVINYYTSDREDDNFYAIFTPVQRIIRVNGVQKSFPAIQILELSDDNSLLNTEHVVLAERVKNDAPGTTQTEVTVLVHEMGSVVFIMANPCGEIQRIVR